MITGFLERDDGDDDDGDDGALMMHCPTCNSGMFTMEIIDDGFRIMTCAFVHCQAIIEVLPPPE